jgi:AbrB family looped-hinge helix DNA binding protein
MRHRVALHGVPVAQVGHVLTRGRGQATLPAGVRLQLDLKDGDDLLIAVEDGRIVLTPATLVPRDLSGTGPWTHPPPVATTPASRQEKEWSL